MFSLYGDPICFMAGRYATRKSVHRPEIRNSAESDTSENAPAVARPRIRDTPSRNMAGRIIKAASIVPIAPIVRACKASSAGIWSGRIAERPPRMSAVGVQAAEGPEALPIAHLPEQQSALKQQQET